MTIFARVADAPSEQGILVAGGRVTYCRGATHPWQWRSLLSPGSGANYHDLDELAHTGPLTAQEREQLHALERATPGAK